MVLIDLMMYQLVARRLFYSKQSCVSVGLNRPQPNNHHATKYINHQYFSSQSTSNSKSPSIADTIGPVQAAAPATWVDGKLTNDIYNTKNTTTTNNNKTHGSSAPASSQSSFRPANYNKDLFDPLIEYTTLADGTQIPVLKPLPNDGPYKQRIRKWYKLNKELMRNFVLIGTIFGLGTYYTLTELSQYYTNLCIQLIPDANELEIAYIAGLCSSLVIFILYRVALRLTRSNSSQLYRYAMKYAVSNPMVVKQLGAVKYTNNSTPAIVNSINTPNMHDSINTNTTTSTADASSATSAATSVESGKSTVDRTDWYTAVMIPNGLRLLPEHNQIQYFGWERYWRPQSLITNFILHGAKYNGIISAHITHKLNGVNDVRQMNLYIPDTKQTYNIVDLPVKFGLRNTATDTNAGITTPTNTNKNTNITTSSTSNNDKPSETR